MSHVFLDRREGRFALYLCGELQFDVGDEALYHEPLGLVPVALAAKRFPGRGLRVLILGGGDGLALREVLRVPSVTEAHLVDRDPDVLALGRGELAGLNRAAFEDPRTVVHLEDVRRFLDRAASFDAVVCDLTYPRDLAGAALFCVDFFERLRRRLPLAGVLAVNAVSPERTPQAFGCIAASLRAAGFAAVPYAFALPSFQAEGYGRWGFLFASRQPIGRRELREMVLPSGVGLTPSAIETGARLPSAAAAAILRAAPNVSDELLCYLARDLPVKWAGPARAVTFPPMRGARRGPRLTARSGFAAWLRAPAGRRSLEGLLRCLPVLARQRLREALLEWAPVAEACYRRLDLAAFVEQALARARELPRAWAQELAALRERLKGGLPSPAELLRHAHRVFAIYLLLLLMANLAFPDSLYAKGVSSGHSSGTTTGQPFQGLEFSSPPMRGWRPRSYYTPVGRSGVVRDVRGQAYPVQAFIFSAAGGPPSPKAVMALSRELQLLEGGQLAYAGWLPGYQALLEPGKLRVLDRAGSESLTLLPPASLEERVRALLRSHAALLAQATLDHRRWLDWVHYASTTQTGRDATSELEGLQRVQAALEQASVVWEASRARPADPDPGPHWPGVFPGIYVEPAAAGAVRRVALALPDGRVGVRALSPPIALTAEDRALFAILWRQAAERRDGDLRQRLEPWLAGHRPELTPLAAVPMPGMPPGALW